VPRRLLASLGVAASGERAARSSRHLQIHDAKPPRPELIEMARKALSFLPQRDQDRIFSKTALTLYPALAKN